jgi:hypothetical protein
MQCAWRIGKRAWSWIAMTMSYAVAFQAMLVGIVTSHSAAAEGSFAASPFVICSGGATRSGTDPSDKAPIRDAPCVLCVAAADSPAILPAATQSHAVAATDTDYNTAPRAAAALANRRTPRQSQGPPRIS